MSLRYIILYSIIMLLVTSSIHAYEKEAYFSHLIFRESPYSPYKGIHEISKKESENLAHYKFSYDSQGRPIEISHRIGDTIIADNGNWDTFIWYGPKTTIEYTKGKETHHFFDLNDNPSVSHGNVFKAEFKLDSNGKRESLSFFDKDNQPVESEWNIHKYQWSQKSENMVIEKRFNLKNKQVPLRPQFKFFEVHLEFLDDGKLAFMYNYGLEGKPTNNDSGAGIDRIVYDRQNNFIRWQVYDKTGLAVEGNSPNVHIGEHLYDASGNKIGLRGFNRSGNQVKFRWGFYEMYNEYDTFGNQDSVKTLNDDGSQNTWMTVDYGKSGIRKIMTKGLDHQGNLTAIPQLGGAAAIKHEYSNGSNISTAITAYDIDMKPLKKKKS